MLAVPASVAIPLTGTVVHLLAAKALYWPDGKLLCIADAHFGKAAAYRALGQPVPGGTTAANLARIDAMLSAHDVADLVFLGDFLHARKSLTPSVIDAVAAWRNQHPALNCTLVRGNHDRRAGDPPPVMGIDVVDEPYIKGPFALSHALAAHPKHHVIAGHIHPVFDLRGAARQRLRLPCFISNTAVTVMPSFGDFTGGYEVAPARGDSIFVTDGTGIWLVRI